jgi:hypothetical protein
MKSSVAIFALLFGKNPCKSTSGCSSVRLEYTSGGRGVASSNLVIPTEKESVKFLLVPF